MLLKITVPSANERGPLFMDQVLGALHANTRAKAPITFLLTSFEKSVSLFCSCRNSLAQDITTQIHAAYPEAEIKSLDAGVFDLPGSHYTWSTFLQLCPDILPIKDFTAFDDLLSRSPGSSLAALFSAVASKKQELLRSTIEVTLQPARRSKIWAAKRCLRRIASFRSSDMALLYARLCRSSSWWHQALAPVISLLSRRAKSAGTSVKSETGITAKDLKAAGMKLGETVFEVSIRLVVTGPKTQAFEARSKLRSLAAAFGIFTDRHTSFVSSGIRTNHTRAAPFLLTSSELATIVHPPPHTVRAETQAKVTSRRFEPPVYLPSPNENAQVAILGRTDFRDRQEIFGMLPEDRFRHVQITGKTGTGKSTLLKSLIEADIKAGRGLAAISPHDDLTEDVLPCIPSNRRDVILFDPSDIEHPIAFNPLSCTSPSQRPLLASGLVSGFKKLFADSWGPRLEHFLRSAILALLEVPDASLLSIQRFLSDAHFRKQIVGTLSDPIICDVWNDFAQWPRKLQAEAVAPIQNKIGAFVSSPLLRNILGQSRNRLDLRRVMDKGEVLLVNLSKGSIGEDNAMLLGSFLVTKLQLEAMSRADIPEKERRDFFLYVDESQNFTTDAFATILSEGRKYRISITTANQYLGQLDEDTLHAQFGNVGTLISFQVGASDSELLAEQLNTESGEGAVTSQDLQNIPKYHALVRLLINGHPSKPFSMKTLKPPETRSKPRRIEAVRNLSRNRHAQKRAQVEQEIQKSLTVIR